MKLSIIIPLYNKEKYINRCLGSLLNQDISLNAYEIIIVDDGSTDSSFSLAKKISKEHNNIQVFGQKNGGPGTARNSGLKEAKGDYVYFLDADDYLAENTLKCLIELAELNNLDILGFNTKYVNDGNHLETSTKTCQDLSVRVTTGKAYIAENGFRNEAWWYFIKRSFLIDSRIKFIEGRFLEDSIFTANIFLKTKRLAKANFDVHRFVKVANSATTNKKPEHILKFIDDLVYAVEEFDVLIKSLDSSDNNYEQIVKTYKRKQQSFVFSIFLKAFRYPHINFNDLKIILAKLENIDAYPINTKYGGMGGSSRKMFVFNKIIVPIFNNKTLLFTGLRIKRLIKSSK